MEEFAGCPLVCRGGWVVVVVTIVVIVVVVVIVVNVVNVVVVVDVAASAVGRAAALAVSAVLVALEHSGKVSRMCLAQPFSLPARLQSWAVLSWAGRPRRAIPPGTCRLP